MDSSPQLIGIGPEWPQTYSSSRPISDSEMMQNAMNSKGFGDFRCLTADARMWPQARKFETPGIN